MSALLRLLCMSCTTFTRYAGYNLVAKGYGHDATSYYLARAEIEKLRSNYSHSNTLSSINATFRLQRDGSHPTRLPLQHNSRHCGSVLNCGDFQST